MTRQCGPNLLRVGILSALQVSVGQIIHRVQLFAQIALLMRRLSRSLV